MPIHAAIQNTPNNRGIWSLRDYLSGNNKGPLRSYNYFLDRALSCWLKGWLWFKIYSDHCITACSTDLQATQVTLLLLAPLVYNLLSSRYYCLLHWFTNYSAHAITACAISLQSTQLTLLPLAPLVYNLPSSRYYCLLQCNTIATCTPQC